MSFETISLLLNWLQMGVLLAILFRLSYTFDLIASTQRELRRAIHRLAERGAAERDITGTPYNPAIPQYARVEYDSPSALDDLASVSPGLSS